MYKMYNNDKMCDDSDRSQSEIFTPFIRLDFYLSIYICMPIFLSIFVSLGLVACAFCTLCDTLCIASSLYIYSNIFMYIYKVNKKKKLAFK